MIVWLASYPRNGSTLLRTQLWQCLGLKSYSNLAKPPLGVWQNPKFLPGHELFREPLEKIYHQHAESGICTLVKTHAPPIDRSRAIYVARDGRQSLYSYYLFHKHHFPHENTTLLDVVLGKCLHGNWSEHYLAWRQQPDRLEVRYPDLVSGNKATLAKLADHVGHCGEIKPWENPFSEFRRQAPHFFRQGEPVWQRPPEWTDRVDEAFWAIHGDVMKELGFGDDALEIPHKEEWLSLKKGMEQKRSLEKQVIELQEQLQALQANIENITWVRKHFRRLKRQYPSLWKTPLQHLYHQVARTHMWRPGKLIQHSPVPLVIPPLPRPQLPEEQLPTMALVIPSFQQGCFIERTLKSVLCQDYPSLQVALMDGGSTDETPEVLEAYRNRLTHVRSESDGGQAAAINLGFQAVPGEICHWLNSDDILLPGAARLAAEFFVKNPRIDVVYGHRILIDADDREIGRQVLPPHDARALNWFDSVPQESLFFRRTAWEKVGGLDANFRFALDWDFLVRLQLAGCRIARLPFFLGCFRIHDHQKTLTLIKTVGEEEMTVIRRRTLGAEFSHEKLQKIYMKHRAWAAICAHLEQNRFSRKVKNFLWSLR
jgi:glycosyltransferase involved in cell wall biosynthesis